MELRNTLGTWVIFSCLIVLTTLTPNGFCLDSSSTSKAELLPDDLTVVGLRELLNFDIEVTSASKKAQKYSDVASAIFVLTQEDIRRSGANSVPEVLRLVPGISVARIDTSRWAITSRGFNSSFADKLLVLIDGQTIFSPGFNGVYWDQFELVLEDIERIEVLRGPGASIWGSNAVNGIINIITFSAQETTGGLVSAGGGNEERFFGSLRYGEKIGEDTFYRVYGRSSKRDNSELVSGGAADDEMQNSRGGFRIDSMLSNKDSLVFKAEGFYNDKDYPVTVPALSPPYVDTESFSGSRRQYGTSLLTHWERTLSPTSHLSTQLDYIYEKQDGKVFPFNRHTLHLESTHRFAPLNNNDVIYGLGYRLYDDSVENTFADAFVPDSRTTHLYNAFVQDEITVLPDKLKLILGSKIEKNDYTGFEFMPNGRAIWSFNEQNSIWTAVSRAVGNPSRVTNDVIVPVAAFPDTTTGLTNVVTLFGNKDVDSHKLMAYELGFRSVPADTLTFDIALFYNDYHDLWSQEPSMPYVGALTGTEGPNLIIPTVFDNLHSAHTYGVEVSAQWSPYCWWRWVAAYSNIDVNIRAAGSLDTVSGPFFEGGTPENQASLRSSIDLPKNVEFDATLRYVDRLAFSGIDDYLELDLRLAWNVSSDLELAVVGQNLLDSAHQEFQGLILPPLATQVERGVYGKLTWLF
ncbi:TonB-dependent receptor [Oligoflexia bacterium]|nr:TonB-dependent receptor [Oligoflexia bacterium]